jgi:hypothetical protein
MEESLTFIEGFKARIEGPLAFRLLLQPLVAIYFAVRDGLKDAREGRSAYFWAFFTGSEHRTELLWSGWKSVGKVFLIALTVDFVFQYLVFGNFRIVGALWAGLILALIPYIALRGPINRLMRSRVVKAPAQ